MFFSPPRCGRNDGSETTAFKVNAENYGPFRGRGELCDSAARLCDREVNKVVESNSSRGVLLSGD